MSAIRTRVYLTDDQPKRIDAISKTEGVTMAEIIRRALDVLSTGIWTRCALIQVLRSRPRSLQRQTRTYRAGMNGIVADLLLDTDVFIDHLREQSNWWSRSIVCTTPW